MSRLLIIDAHAVLHRAYHSIPPLTTNGQPVNALYGFYSMLLSALDQLKPKYLIVCFDSPGPTFRSQEFIGYRAKRRPPEHDLITQLPLLPQSLDTARISSFSLGGYEADDLIATVTRQALKCRSKIKVTIITGDKDMMQLVGNQVELFMPLRGLSETKIFGPNEVKEKLGVLPSQVIDLKALMGDLSDNYPGVAGIGPKTAVDLLTKYQTFNNIYSHLSNLSDLVRQKLINDRDSAYLSRKLATLVDNIPLKLKLSSARLGPKQIAGLESIFKSYNFKSLLSRLQRKHFPKSAKLLTDSQQKTLF